MKYFGRNGNEIDRQQWVERFMNPTYCHLAKASAGNVQVETSWVGVVGETEKVPGLFLTQAFQMDDKGKPVADMKKDVWTPTEEAARIAHEQVCVELWPLSKGQAAWKPNKQKKGGGCA
jgi:hypothetical protein